MNTIFRASALAFALIGGAALLASPASANSFDNEGYFGGSWSSISPEPYFERRSSGRVGPLYSGRYRRGSVYYGTPGYGWSGPYGSPYGYQYGPGIGAPVY